MIGSMPVATTSRTSMPVGAPPKSSAGIAKSGFCAAVISSIDPVLGGVDR